MKILLINSSFQLSVTILKKTLSLDANGKAGKLFNIKSLRESNFLSNV